ncbi:class I tRNA ligase family protein [Streptacidiphilus sp. ASG 303]|uniref:class I tRNA ligase family protein n=1 Tax=Streptacidiphilus sp. ASG 303 TaxID=2896847 RepID=UPI001E4D97DC|nr:class I tRNA ligase family protein [Streptacidiphilus sp. ASG 303]MCD0485886.1 class I tRNA ligase family protein [Streptacidiphilus sp. ASG 303]
MTVPRTVDELNLPDFVRSVQPAWARDPELPVNVRRVTLRPGETTAPHNHHDIEVWVILDGNGEVTSDGETVPVAAGDALRIPPLSVHTLHNPSEDRPLSFLTLWWDDPAALDAEHDRRAARTVGTGRPVLLLPSFPTPNGELHLGHLAGPFLNADLLRRGLAGRGTPVRLLLGTVGHQSQVAAAAREQGLTFYQLAERNTDAIQEALAAAGIEWDVFVRPSSPRYPQVALEVFERLRADGTVTARTVQANYCAPCGTYLFEAFVAGSCPHCGSRDTAGIECEACALPFADDELVDPSCRACGTPAEQRGLTRYYMPLEPLRARLADYLRSVSMSARLRSYVDRVLAGPLPDLPVSTVATDGVPLPPDPSGGTDGQRMYSAFELAARFVTAVDDLAVQQGLSGWEEYAETEAPRTVLFFGFDNAFLRAVVFPAVLGAFTDKLALADTMVCNEFYLLDGQKFSTGRKHAIWGRDAFRPETSDQLRLHLAATSPDIRRRDFAVAGYREFVRSELLGEWESWLVSVDGRLRKHFDGVAPEAGSWNVEAEQFYGRIRAFATRLANALQPEGFSARTAAGALREFVAEARRFTEICEDVLLVQPVSATARTCMALELAAVRAVAVAAEPLMPGLAARLAQQLGESGPAAGDAPVRWVTPGTAVALTGPYFSADALTGPAH